MMEKMERGSKEEERIREFIPSAIWKDIEDTRVIVFTALGFLLPRRPVEGDGAADTTYRVAVLVTRVGGYEAISSQILVGELLAVARRLVHDWRCSWKDGSCRAGGKGQEGCKAI